MCLQIRPCTNILAYVHRDIAVLIDELKTVHEDSNNVTHFKYKYKLS